MKKIGLLRNLSTMAIVTPALMPLFATSLTSCTFEFRIKQTFNVHFETNGGSPISDAKVTQGKLMVKPDDPVKAGFKFIWWYTDSACTNPYHFNQEVYSNFTLFAKWEKIPSTSLSTNV